MPSHGSSRQGRSKTPAQREIAACHDWLEQELASVKPQVIVALGGDGVSPLVCVAGPDEEARRQAYRVIVEGLRQALRLVAG